MAKVKVYYNKTCQKCANHARMIKFADFFGWVETTTLIPPTGELNPGEIIVENLKTHKFYKNLAGSKHYFRFIPLYWFFLPFLYLPFANRFFMQNEIRCIDNSCKLN